jgi:hypothetical protein
MYVYGVTEQEGVGWRIYSQEKYQGRSYPLATRTLRTEYFALPLSPDPVCFKAGSATVGGT